MFPRMMIVGLALGLAACVPEPVAPPLIDPLTTENACGADDLQGLVGQSASVLATMRFGQTVRVIRPGMGVTMDFSPQRLNIEVDADEVITRISCG